MFNNVIELDLTSLVLSHSIFDLESVKISVLLPTVDFLVHVFHFLFLIAFLDSKRGNFTDIYLYFFSESSLLTLNL